MKKQRKKQKIKTFLFMVEVRLKQVTEGCSWTPWLLPMSKSRCRKEVFDAISSYLEDDDSFKGVTVRGVPQKHLRLKK